MTDGALPVTGVTLDRLNRTTVISLFRTKKEEIDGQIARIKEVTVTTPEAVVEAENYLRLVKDSIEYLEKTRKNIIAPYQEVISDCNDAIGSIIDKIKEADKDLRQRIMKFQQSYATVQIGNIVSDYEDQKKKVLLSMELNQRVNIIGKQFYARLFGGLGPKLDGTTSSFPGIESIADANAFVLFVEAKFPNMNSFGEYRPTMEYIRMSALKIVEMIKEKLSAKNSGLDVSDIEIAINDEKDKFMVRVDEEFVQTTKNLEKKLASVDKKFEAEKKSLNKGIAWSWDFEVIDPVAVPPSYRSIDEKKIKAYITKEKENLEKIVVDVINEKDGTKGLTEQPIAGVRIFKKSSKRISS